MRKIAIIDIGSNSVRLMMTADGNVLYKRLCTTRLGEGIAEKNVLKDIAMQRTSDAINKFSKESIEEGAEKVYAYATAAVRSAENGKEFVEKVKKLTGVEIEVLSGEVEAECGILGSLGNNDGCIIDIGGGSTEIIVRSLGKISYKKSLNIGVVRLKDMAGRDIDKLKPICENFADKYEISLKDKNVYAIGGTATTLAALFNRMEKYDSSIITGTQISSKIIEIMAEKLIGMPTLEIAKLPCVTKGREDVIGGGAVLLSTIMKKLKIDKITVSDRDNLEGFAILKGLM